MALSPALKRVTTNTINFIEEADRSLANGWQWTDAWNFMDEVFAIPATVKEVPEAWAVVKAGLSDEDLAEYVNFIKEELQTVHEDAEQKAEAIIAWMANTERLYRLFEKKKV